MLSQLCSKTYGDRFEAKKLESLLAPNSCQAKRWAAFDVPRLYLGRFSARVFPVFLFSKAR